MKKVSLVLLITISLLIITSSIAIAKGGSSNGEDVCWMGGGGETRAIFYTTNSGIVHEWRYMPAHMHVIFKPVEKFSDPEEPGWFMWKSHIYSPCSTPTDYTVDDYLGNGKWYWVLIVNQE